MAVKTKFTAKQKKFADEWLKDHNGTRAYRVAYPTVKKDETAKAAASRLLTNVNVESYIQKKQALIAYKNEITHDRILREEMCIAFSDITRLFSGPTPIPPDELPEDLRRAVSSIKIKELPLLGKSSKQQYEYEYRFWDKGRALERLEKHLGMFEKDNQQRGISIQELFESLSEISPDLALKIKEKLLSGSGSGK